MTEAKVCGKTISYGKQYWRVNNDGQWQVLMYGSHGPNDPPVGLSWKWRWVSKDCVPKEVLKLA